MFRVLADKRVVFVFVCAGALLAIALWPRTLDVDVATVARGPLVVTIDEEGRTRVRDRFIVSAPVSGRVLRIGLEPGDAVARGQVMARMQPESPPLLDVRARAEAEAAVAGAEAVLGRARAEEQRARAAEAQARRELDRSRKLVAGGAMPARESDVLEDEVRLAGEAVTAAAFAARAAEAELERARTRIARPSVATGAGTVAVRSPVDGVVLRRLRESESIVAAGESLLEVGDPRRLEIVVDLLSTDAVRVKAGARAMIEQWGGEGADFGAAVRRVEPAGFTKLSALGVEEQRVNVILEPLGAPADGPLGDAYRVDVRIVLWEAPDVLKVPTSALFREGDQWAVYGVRDGRARRTIVALGHQTPREAEVTEGLSEGDQVIVHPGDLVLDGTRVTASASQ
jgi:HlyD family secretion protein